MRESLAILLRSHGFDVSLAASGAEALATCAREPAYDAVMVDAYMRSAARAHRLKVSDALTG